MQAVLSDNTIRIYDAFLHRESVKEIAGRRYDAEDKAWVVPLTKENAAYLRLIGAETDAALNALLAETAEPQKAQPVRPMPIKATPYQHQIRAFNFAEELYKKRKGFALLADMGTGKTLITIAIAGRLSETKCVRKMLVVCPKTIVDVWAEEFQKFADYRYALSVLDGSADKKKQAFGYMQGNALQVIVVNYESCWRLENEIAKWKPDFIVCDESSKIKNPQAKQSKSLHRLGRLSKYNMILTGTPITNNPLDLYSQYKFLDESIFGPSFYGFRAKYAIIGGYQNHQIVGYRNLAELVIKAHSIAFRIKIEDAADLPPFIDEVRNLQLEPSAQAIYDKIERDSYAELAEGEVTIRNVLTKLLRISQCTGGYVRGDEMDSAVQQISCAKMDALEDIVDACLVEGRKVVVFARFVPEIEAIARMLKKKGVGYSLVMGSVKDRAEEVRKFQEEPEIKVFIGQIQTVGMGLTLTAASVAVYYSLDFNYANYEQSRARIHRIGQKEKCLYIHLVCKSTVDEKIMTALRHKGDVARLIVDNWKELTDGQA